MKKLFITVITLFLIQESFKAQILINKEWEQTNGIPSVAFNYQTSVKDKSNNIIIIGNTYRPGQQENVYLVKYSSDGTFLWDKELNGLSSAVDLGIDVTTDVNDNIYCTGVMHDSSATHSSIFVIKVDKDGNDKWDSKIYDSFSGYAAPSDIMIIGNKVYISGTLQTGTFSFLGIISAFDTTDGSNLWNVRRGFSNSYNGFVGMTYNAFNQRVTAHGFSGLSFTNWKYYSVTVAASNGAFVSQDTSSASTVGFSSPVDIIKDKKDNMYVAGFIQKSSSDFDIRVVKFDSAFIKIWEKDFDWNGKDDRPTAINFTNDDESSLFVTGYSRNNSDVNLAALIKLSAVNGDTLFKFRNEAFESKLEKIQADPISQTVYVVGSRIINGKSHYLTQAFDTSGLLKWERTFAKGSQSEGKTLTIDSFGKITVSGRTYDTAWQYTTIQYDKWETPTDYYEDTASNPVFMQKRILVKVNQDSVNITMMNEKDKRFGSISDFMGQAIQDSFVSYFGTAMSNSVVSKICQIRPVDSISVTRVGTQFNMKNTSTLLAINYPESIRTSEIEICKTISSRLFGTIIYAHPDYLGTLDSANDTHYGTSQFSLRNTASYPGASINIHPAWDLLGDDSLSFIRVGVIDDGADWSHPDLGDRIKGGYNYENSSNIFSSNIGKGDHGTKVAGIIGAIRNNALGVAGIAGGTVGTVNPNNGGVSLYPIRVLMPSIVPVSKVYAAILDNISYIPDEPDYAYGLQIINCSWGFSPNEPYFVDTNIYALQDAIYYANKNFVSIVASRGNSGNNLHRFPATYGDGWVLSVGGSGSNGERAVNLNTQGANTYNSNFGRDMDFIAPSWDAMIRTTGTGNLYPSFARTSAAAAHVTGIVAMIKAYLDTHSSFINYTMPDDIENILQISASDKSVAGYDDTTGWGLVDAGAALELVNKNSRYLKHFIYGHNSSDQLSSQFITGPFQATFTGPFQINNVWHKEGKYNVELYQLEATIFAVLDNINDVVLHDWNLGSYCDFLAPIDTAVINPSQSNSTNDAYYDPLLGTFAITGNFYKVFDTLNNFLGFYPNDYVSPPTSFYAGVGAIIQKEGTGIKPIKTNDCYLTVYPVPSSTYNKVDISLSKPAHISLSLFDVSGRKISQIFNAHVAEKNTTVTNDVATLSDGVYFYKAIVNGETFTLKFIKN